MEITEPKWPPKKRKLNRVLLNSPLRTIFLNDLLKFYIFVSAQNKISFTSDKNTNNKSTFLRKSAILTTGDNNFKFNFQPQPDTGISEAEKCKVKADDEISNSSMIPIKNKLSQLNLNPSNGFKFNFEIADVNNMD